MGENQATLRSYHARNAQELTSVGDEENEEFECQTLNYGFSDFIVFRMSRAPVGGSPNDCDSETLKVT